MASTKTIAQNIDIPQPHDGRIGWAVLTTANTAKDGTGTTATLFTADTEGSVPFFVACKPLGTNVASVLRVFINNGSTSATAANNSLYKELDLPATTITETAANADVILPLNITFLPSGYKINVCIATTVAAGWQVTCVGGDY